MWPKEYIRSPIFAEGLKNKSIFEINNKKIKHLCKSKNAASVGR
jgi:hypothetical protein